MIRHGVPIGAPGGTAQESDKLTLHQAAYVAQKPLARGVRLNYPEAVTLIASQILELETCGHASAAVR